MGGGGLARAMFGIFCVVGCISIDFFDAESSKKSIPPKSASKVGFGGVGFISAAADKEPKPALDSTVGEVIISPQSSSSSSSFSLGGCVSSNLPVCAVVFLLPLTAGVGGGGINSADFRSGASSSSHGDFGIDAGESGGLSAEPALAFICAAKAGDCTTADGVDGTLAPQPNVSMVGVCGGASC